MKSIFRVLLSFSLLTATGLICSTTVNAQEQHNITVADWNTKLINAHKAIFHLAQNDEQWSQIRAMVDELKVQYAPNFPKRPEVQGASNEELTAINQKNIDNWILQHQNEANAYIASVYKLASFMASTSTTRDSHK